MSLISFSIHFRILNEFLEFIIENRNLEKGKRNLTVLGQNLAHGLAATAWPARDPGVHAPTAGHRDQRADGGVAAVVTSQPLRAWRSLLLIAT
jgi:hypothetical protein